MGEQAQSASEGSDAQLVARSTTQPSLFGELFERHYDDIYRYLARRIGAERADDLASQTFVVAFERRDSFDSDAGHVRGWLFGIATHLLWNERRAEQRLLRTVTQMQRQAVPDDAGLEVERWQLDAVLGAALLQLDADQRDVLLLTAWGELSYDEVAAALSVPVGTVRSRLSRARAQLRTQLRCIPTNGAAGRAVSSKELT